MRPGGRRVNYVVKKYTHEEAVEKGRTKWWCGKTAFEIVKEQLYVEQLILICPDDLFHESLQEVLGRKIYRIEYKKYQLLRNEFELKSKIISFHELQNRIR